MLSLTDDCFSAIDHDPAREALRAAYIAILSWPKNGTASLAHFGEQTREAAELALQEEPTE